MPNSFNIALEQLKTRRQHDEAELLERRMQLYHDIPELRDIDGKMSRAVSQIFPLGGQPEKIAALRNEYFALQSKQRKLLRDNNLPDDILDPVIYCAVCRDEGYQNGKPCKCLLELSAAAERKQLSSLLNLGGQTFEHFRLDIYSDKVDQDFGVSPRQVAQENFTYCRDYAKNFTPMSKNILMIGFPGLGKTFLSAAIAGKVAGKGFSVVYDTIGTIMATMEREKFSGQDTEQGSDKYLNCDLLIIDDLGTEMQTTFTQSALYTLINSRINKPTVINTNLTEQEITTRYSAALVSRLLGLYRKLIFFGDDLRQRLEDRV